MNGESGEAADPGIVTGCPETDAALKITCADPAAACAILATESLRRALVDFIVREPGAWVTGTDVNLNLPGFVVDEEELVGALNRVGQLTALLRTWPMP